MRCVLYLMYYIFHALHFLVLLSHQLQLTEAVLLQPVSLFQLSTTQTLHVKKRIASEEDMEDQSKYRCIGKGFCGPSEEAP